MSRLTSVFNEVEIPVPDRSGFDLSHDNAMTALCGTLTPCLCREVYPGDVHSLGANFSVQLPPMSTTFKGRIDYRMEFFFVPNRQVWLGWKDFICQDPNHKPVVPSYTVPTTLPSCNLSYYDGSGTSVNLGPGSLADYLGLKGKGSYSPVSGESSTIRNILPFLCYHKIVDEYYRDKNIQQPFFVEGLDQSSTISSLGVSALPYIRTNASGLGPIVVNVPNATFGSNSYYIGMYGYNGVSLFSLRQRLYSKDYFTTCTTYPQNSTIASSVGFTVNTSTGAGSFTIATLRAANSLQKWLERNNIGDTAYYSQIMSHFGVVPSDYVMNKPIFLGGVSKPVIVDGVAQTAETDQTGSNPFDTVGAMYGNAYSAGEGSIFENFVAKEHGYLIGIASLVPHAAYSEGMDRTFTRKFSLDFPFPEFANVGDEPVYSSELYSDVSDVDFDSTAYSTFGYNQRFAHLKIANDEIHGLLRHGQSLQQFALQRSYSDTPSLGTNFLEIPSTALDGILAVSSAESGYSCIPYIHFEHKCLRCFPQFILPSL